MTPLLSKSLDSQQLGQHRALVAVELEVLAKKFDRFGWERDRGKVAHDRLMSDWMDALHDYTLPEIQKACKAAVLDNPSKMPNEGHIKALIIKQRGKDMPKPIEAAEPDRPEPTPEMKKRADDILKNAGFKR